MEEWRSTPSEEPAPSAPAVDGEAVDVADLAKQFAAGLPDLSALSGLLGGGGSLLGGLLGGSRPRKEGTPGPEALLCALRPYLSPRRQAAVDAFLNLTKLIDTLRRFTEGRE